MNRPTEYYPQSYDSSDYEDDNPRSKHRNDYIESPRDLNSSTSSGPSKYVHFDLGYYLSRAGQQFNSPRPMFMQNRVQIVPEVMDEESIVARGKSQYEDDMSKKLKSNNENMQQDPKIDKENFKIKKRYDRCPQVVAPSICFSKEALGQSEIGFNQLATHNFVEAPKVHTIGKPIEPSEDMKWNSGFKNTTANNKRRNMNTGIAGPQLIRQAQEKLYKKFPQYNSENLPFYSKKFTELYREHNMADVITFDIDYDNVVNLTEFSNQSRLEASPNVSSTNVNPFQNSVNNSISNPEDIQMFQNNDTVNFASFNNLIGLFM